MLNKTIIFLLLLSCSLVMAHTAPIQPAEPQTETKIIISNKKTDQLKLMKHERGSNDVIINSDSNQKTVTVPEKEGLKIITDKQLKNKPVHVKLPNGDRLEVRKGPNNSQTITIKTKPE